MEILMKQTVTETINGGRTTQEFTKGAAYQIPDEIGQLWIGRGWAEATAKPAVHPAAKRKE